MRLNSLFFIAPLHMNSHRFVNIKLFLILVIACSFTYKGTGQQMIPWSPQRLLSWDDFKGKPHPRSSVGAVTYSGIRYAYESAGDSIRISVTATFDPGISWVNIRAANAYVLRHEQNHFDITELYARKLRAALKKINPSIPRPHLAAEKLYSRFAAESRDYQDRYDKETDHSRNQANQSRWDQLIKTELARFDEVSDTLIFLNSKSMR